MRTDNTKTLTITEVAEQLGISRGLAYQEARKGTIPVLKIGSRMLVSKSRLEKFLLEGQVK